jgi:radical SAM superfamily enzyme YgiQ (UPF0313 family)
MLERNVVFKDFRDKIRVALVYPNSYTIGMANLGFRILYDLLNSMENVYAERFFLDFNKSLETKSELKEFEIIAFTWQFELDALNILDILYRNKIPLRRDRRKQVVIVGGPCAVNPYPLKKFVDFFFIGEAEENLVSFINDFSRGGDIYSLSKIEGVYSSELDNYTRKVYVSDLDRYHPIKQIMSPEAALGESFLLEVSRGCGRGCRFCMSGYTFRPQRERSFERLQEIADRGIEACASRKISLIGASASDYPRIEDLCEYLSARGVGLSIPSLRADSLTEPIVEALVKTGQRSLTLAPESNWRLRTLVNKPIEDEDILRAYKMSIDRGIKNIKLYLMVGIPTETSEDLNELVGLIKELKKISGRVRLSVNPLIPKPHTPFQWLGLEKLSDLREKIEVLKKARVQMEVEDLKMAHIQATISLGDEGLSDILEKAYFYGKGLGAFRRAFKEEGVEFDYYIRGRDTSEILPWEKIDVGVKKSFLIREFKKSFKGEVTSICREGCRVCGVC